MVKKESNERLVIKLKITKNIFDKIHKSIEDSRLFLSIYQINKKDSESKDKKNNPEQYYLAPFKERDENPVFSLSYGSVEYEYSRVARLILEYYDQQNKTS